MQRTELEGSPNCLSFQPTRQAAFDRLDAFLPNAATHYRRTRNFDFGQSDRNNVSVLSPYIRNGLISEAEVVRAVLSRHTFAASEKFIQEVFWRTYWKGYLQNRPAIWQNYLADLKQLKHSSQTAEQTEVAERGETGIACFDAWAKELATTGYLHNHSRMWFASIWIFTLKLPWQLGADFFFRHLLDGDPASNTLSWRWVAGLHTHGKTYLARPSNIDRYTDERFPSPTQLATHASPLSEPHPLPAPDFKPLPEAPRQFTANEGLIVLDEDLRHSAETHQTGIPTLGLYPNRSYTDLGLSGAVKRFRLDSLASVLTENETLSSSLETDPSPEAIVDWARQNHVTTLNLAEPKVGPWRDLWQDFHPKLEAAGLAIRPFRPWWENELFPNANNGFFKLKTKLPAVCGRIMNENAIN